MRSRNRSTMQQIINFVNRYDANHHRSPSTTEIATELDMNNTTVYRYLVEMSDTGMIRYDGHQIVTKSIGKADAGMTSAAVLGSVSCGMPMLEEEFAESYVSLPTALFGEGEFYILRANGTSMIEAGIDDGDLVIIRKQDSAKDGEIVVALLEDGTNTLKRFHIDRKHGYVVLHPENRKMQDIIVKSCSVQGVAVKVLKNL